jgi:hypothetical protein
MDGNVCHYSDTFCAVCRRELENAIPLAFPCRIEDLASRFDARERWRRRNIKWRTFTASVPPCWVCDKLTVPAARVLMDGFDTANATLVVYDDRHDIVATGRPIDATRIEVSFSQSPLHQYWISLEFRSPPRGPLEITTELYRNGVKEALP